MDYKVGYECIDPNKRRNMFENDGNKINRIIKILLIEFASFDKIW